MPPITLTRTLAGAAGALFLATAGCVMQPSFSVKVTTADGVEMEVPLSKRFEINASDDVMEVTNFKFMPVKNADTSTLGMAYELKFKGGAKPASVVVDDVTEEPIISMMADEAPKLVRGDRWQGLTQAFSPADEHVNWISTLDNGVRVYRFTAKLTNGTVDVLRLPVFVPGGTKALFREELGIK